jgi:hypothetical protein
MLVNHCPDLRFDVEYEGKANNSQKLYDFVIEFASDPREGQTQNSDGMD